MNYSNIKYNDIANGVGVRTSLFVSGCPHRCLDCFNEITWDKKYGNKFTEQTINEIVNSLKEEHIQGLTLLGGEPFAPYNQEMLVELLTKVHNEYKNEKDIWCYTGYVYPQDFIEGGRAFTKFTNTMLSYIDILVDGPFVTSQKDIRLKFKGSSNQRIIDLKNSHENKIKILEF